MKLAFSLRMLTVTFLVACATPVTPALLPTRSIPAVPESVTTAIPQPVATAITSPTQVPTAQSSPTVASIATVQPRPKFAIVPDTTLNVNSDRGMPVIRGVADPETEITFAAGYEELGRTKSDASGQWSFQLPKLGIGSNRIFASYAADSTKRTDQLIVVVETDTSIAAATAIALATPTPFPTRTDIQQGLIGAQSTRTPPQIPPATAGSGTLTLFDFAEYGMRIGLAENWRPLDVRRLIANLPERENKSDENLNYVTIAQDPTSPVDGFVPNLTVAFYPSEADYEEGVRFEATRTLRALEKTLANGNGTVETRNRQIGLRTAYGFIFTNTQQTNASLKLELVTQIWLVYGRTNEAGWPGTFSFVVRAPSAIAPAVAGQIERMLDAVEFSVPTQDLRLIRIWPQTWPATGGYPTDLKQITGTAPPGMQIEIVDLAGPVAKVQANSSGRWTWDLPGPISFEARFFARSLDGKLISQPAQFYSVRATSKANAFQESKLIELRANDTRAVPTLPSPLPATQDWESFVFARDAFTVSLPKTWQPFQFDPSRLDREIDQLVTLNPPLATAAETTITLGSPMFAANLPELKNPLYHPALIIKQYQTKSSSPNLDRVTSDIATSLLEVTGGRPVVSSSVVISNLGSVKRIMEHEWVVKRPNETDRWRVISYVIPVSRGSQPPVFYGLHFYLPTNKARQYRADFDEIALRFDAK